MEIHSEMLLFWEKRLLRQLLFICSAKFKVFGDFVYLKCFVHCLKSCRVAENEELQHRHIYASINNAMLGTFLMGRLCQITLLLHKLNKCQDQEMH